MLTLLNWHKTEKQHLRASSDHKQMQAYISPIMVNSSRRHSFYPPAIAFPALAGGGSKNRKSMLRRVRTSRLQLRLRMLRKPLYQTLNRPRQSGLLPLSTRNLR